MRPRRRNPAARTRPALVGVLATLAACGRPDLTTLVVRAPSRIEQAVTSTDATLCAQLDVALTFDRTDDVAAAPVDGERLTPKPDAPCTWALDGERQLRAGTYDLIARFTTREAAKSCSAPVLVGAYVKRDLTFPFPADFAGLTDADFVSRPGEEAALGESGVDFDLEDDGRDNLAEIAVGSDPCQESSVPVVSLSFTSTGGEGEEIVVALQTNDADGIDHHVGLRIAHENPLQARPEYATTEVALDVSTDPAVAPRQIPAVIDIPPREQWSLQTVTQASGSGQGAWEVTFHVDEPFIGTLSFTSWAHDGQGNILVPESSRTLTVANVEDSTSLLFDIGGTEVATTSLTFAEEGNEPPTEYSFRFVDDDLDDDASTWVPALVSGPTTPVMLSQGTGVWNIAWTPTNADVLRLHGGADAATIEFRDGSGTPFDSVVLSLSADPLWNDSPTINPPPIGLLALPAPPFSSRALPFGVEDPDEVIAAPTCTVTLAAKAPTPSSCTAPFGALSCGPVGQRAGAHWDFEVEVVPAADYEAQCGTAPIFDLTIEITDAAPASAGNGDRTATTDDCDTFGCTPTLEVRTEQVVTGTVVSGGAGAVPGFTDSSAAVVEGSVPAAVIGVTGGPPDYDDVVTVVDLGYPSPSTSAQIGPADLCSIDAGSGVPAREVGIGDPVNRRILVYGRQPGTTTCNGNNVVALVDLDNLAAPAVAIHQKSDVCAATRWPGNPVRDDAGNLYVPCGGEPGRIVRFDGAGTMLAAAVADFVDACNCADNDDNAVLVDPDGTAWMVWPDDDGLLLLRLDTFADTAPTTQRVTVPTAATWEPDKISDHAVDAGRFGYIFLYQPSSGSAELWRLILATGGAPSLDGPLALSNTGGRSLILREPSGEPASETDLVVGRTSSYNDVPHVDLDGWSVVADRPSSDYYLSYGPGIFSSPDRRYYVAPVLSAYEDSSLKGVYLYAWDPAMARQFIDLGVPARFPFDKPWSVTVSDAGNLMTVAGGDEISVIYFRDAAAGLD